MLLKVFITLFFNLEKKRNIPSPSEFFYHLSCCGGNLRNCGGNLSCCGSNLSCCGRNLSCGGSNLGCCGGSLSCCYWLTWACFLFSFHFSFLDIEAFFKQ